MPDRPPYYASKPARALRADANRPPSHANQPSNYVLLFVVFATVMLMLFLLSLCILLFSTQLCLPACQPPSCASQPVSHPTMPASQPPNYVSQLATQLCQQTTQRFIISIVIIIVGMVYASIVIMVVITMLAMLPNYVNQRPRILFICVVSLLVDLAIIMIIDSYSYYHSANHAALLCQPACQVPKPSLLGRSSQVRSKQSDKPASQPGRASARASQPARIEKSRN